MRHTMASNRRYWKCADCNSLINDENMHEVDHMVGNTGNWFDPKYAEFCYGCMNYNPEVVIAYA